MRRKRIGSKCLTSPRGAEDVFAKLDPLKDPAVAGEGDIAVLLH